MPLPESPVWPLGMELEDDELSSLNEEVSEETEEYLEFVAAVSGAIANNVSDEDRDSHLGL